MFFLKTILFCQLFLITITSISCESSNEKCLKSSRSDIENHLSTKTPYRVVANKNDSEIFYKDCKPIRIWSLIRHGSRNPSREIIRSARQNLMKLREQILSSSQTHLCPHELAMFRNWSFNIEEDDEKFLVYEGEDELIELAERIQHRFPTLLPDTYDPLTYKFKYTATQRTRRSAESFAIGLFGRDNLRKITYPEAIYKDPVLRFYKLCDKWIKQVNKNPETLMELKKFQESEQFNSVIEDISRITGLSKISIDDVQLMYKICGFETAWNKQRDSPWCTLFNNNSIRILEFTQDLEYYWIDGYGYDLTYRQACPAFSDMINHIEPTSTEPNATFYFTHSGTILKMLAHLGLYKDDYKLTHKDFERPRKWKVSKIDSFASNILFITFMCESEPKILVMHQETVVNIPGCPANSDLCDLTTFKEIFSDSISNCDFSEICDLERKEKKEPY